MGRHQNVVDQRRNDFAERTADNHTDGHIHHVALDGELLELFQKSHFINTLFNFYSPERSTRLLFDR